MPSQPKDRSFLATPLHLCARIHRAWSSARFERSQRRANQAWMAQQEQALAAQRQGHVSW